MKDAINPVLHLLRSAAEDERCKRLTDEQLLGRFRSDRDEDAFHVLVNRHGSMVYDVCRNVVGNRADAEDAFQATFLVLAQKAAAIRKHASLASWLHGVAYRIALKARRDDGRRKKHETVATARRFASVSDDVTWCEVQQVIHEELSALAECYRAPLVLCYLEGKTQDEAARLLGVSTSTMKKRLERGRGLLRARLVRRNLGPAALLIAASWPNAGGAAVVPATLVSSTVKVIARGNAADPVLSAEVVALTKGALKTMLLGKITTAIALALVVSVSIAATLLVEPMLSGQDKAARNTETNDDLKEVKGKTAPAKVVFPDLTKIDRTIVKEPKYLNQPYYALLVFGPEAKKRAWLVVDGETLYVDRNGNGDLTEANKRIQKSKKIEVAPGMYKWMDSYDIGEVEGVRLRLDFWVRDKDFVADWDFDKQIQKEYQLNGWESSTLWRVGGDGENIWAQIPLTFCQRPRDAQICHVAGPLTMAWRDERPFVRGADNHLAIMIGTPGLPPRNSDRTKFAPVSTEEVPANLHPVAHLEFPHKDAKQPPIKLELVLDKRCCGDDFYGPAPVPVDAAAGKVRVTVSFPAWPEGKVASATFEVPLVDKAPPAEKEPLDHIRRPSWVGKAGPDRLLLGTVAVGATVEASFIVYEKSNDPKNVSLTIETPAFVSVLDKSVIEQDVFDGQNGSVKGVSATVIIGIDTSKAGVYAGEVKVKLGNASAKVPVAATVKLPESNAARIVVAESPFVAFTTDDGRAFKDWTDLVSEAKWNVSYLTFAKGKPVFRDLDLSKFDVILLVEGALLQASADDIKQVRAFVERGGRLVLAANRFYVGTVEATNKFIDGYGLKMIDEEAPSDQSEAILDAKAFAPELVKAGIVSVRFYRGSPVTVTDAKRARILVKAVGVGGPEDGFVAVANAGKGEVIVLGKSLWWSWLSAEQAKGTDNSKLFRLLLNPNAERKK